MRRKGAMRIMATPRNLHRKLSGAVVGGLTFAILFGAPAGADEADSSEVAQWEQEAEEESVGFDAPASATRDTPQYTGSMKVNTGTMARASLAGSLTPRLTTNEVTSLAVGATREAAIELDEFRDDYEPVGNGKLPNDALCKLPWTNKSVIRCDAERSFELLDAAFKAEFGTDIDITDSYRSYEKQVEVKKQVGKNAAVPGYSNHGNGIALDLGSGIADASSPQSEWMREHAAEFGWYNPTWAGGESRDGVESHSKPKSEPWHWEFHGIDGLTPTPVLAW